MKANIIPIDPLVAEQIVRASKFIHKKADDAGMRVTIIIADKKDSLATRAKAILKTLKNMILSTLQKY